MAPRFISKTSLTGLHPVSLDGTRLLDLHRRLQELLSTEAVGVTTLFAEPVVTWPSPQAPGSVSWYTEEAGPAEKLADLEPSARELLKGRLREWLQQLQPLLDDAGTGPLLRRALSLGHEGGIMSVGGAPVLTEWGLSSVTSARPTRPSLAARHGWAPIWTQRPSSVRRPPPTGMSLPPTQQAAPASIRWWLVPAAALVAVLFLGIGCSSASAP